MYTETEYAENVWQNNKCVASIITKTWKRVSMI